MELSGKHVVVTGAASGIGRALALRFAAEGARGVVVADLDDAGAKAVAIEIESRGGEALAVGCDAGDPAQTVALVDRAEAAYGVVDLFCANAGVQGGAGLAETPDDVWRHAFEVNVLAHVAAARRLLPAWLERGEGYFLSTASAAGLLSVVGSAAYATTKSAAIAFAEWLAITYGDRGIRVSCLCPSAVRTPMLESALQQDGEVGRGMRIVTQSGPVLDPVDVAAAVVSGLAAERFLVLPHPQVQKMYAGRSADIDGWIAIMQHAKAAVERTAVERT